MTYKPPVSKGNWGTNGQVKIAKVENGKVYFFFREQTKEALLDPVKMSPIKVEDCSPVAIPGVWCATLSTNKDKLFGLRPIQGVYPAKFKEFVAPKDEQPSPKMSGGKPEFQHLVFTPLFVLTREDVKDMVVRYQYGLDYAFTPFTAEDGTQIVGYGKRLDRSPHMQAVDEFMNITGIWDRGAMKWQENLLPVMQRRALDADKSFMVYIENGYIKNLIPDSTGAFDETDEAQNKLETGVEE